MKRLTVTIGSEDFEEILREHLAAVFPTMEIDTASLPYLGDITIRLRRKDTPAEPLIIEPAPPYEPPPPLGRPDDVVF